MSRAFAITAATPNVRLNASGQGEFSFTLSNALGRAARARITLVAEGNTQRGWLTVAGDLEKDLPADGTQQLTVKVATPAGTAQGTYSFHVLVSTVTNPDEEYADGPTVSFEVAPSVVPKKPFPWWIVAVAAGAALILVITLVVFTQLRGHSGLHAECNTTDKKCPGNLLCVAKAGSSECLAPVAAKCKTDLDCEPGRCADNLCAELPTGARCPPDTSCGFSQKCTDVRPGLKACLLKKDRHCTNDIECASGFCTEAKTCSREDGRCDAATAAQDCRPGVSQCQNNLCLLVAGQECTADTQCTTGFCDGTCKPSPPCVPPCLPPNFCSRGVCRFVLLHPIPLLQLRNATPVQP